MKHISRDEEIPGVSPRQPYVVSDPRPVHLLRRLGAVFYDSLLLLAVLFAAGLPLPLIPEALRWETWARFGTFVYLVIVSFLFFGWFWTHGGQTLGMRAWRFRVVTDNRHDLTWPLAGRRFAWAVVSWSTAGAGFLWSLFDPQWKTWHDRLSGTRLIRTSPMPEEQRTDAQKQHGR